MKSNKSKAVYSMTNKYDLTERFTLSVTYNPALRSIGCNTICVLTESNDKSYPSI